METRRELPANLVSKVEINLQYIKSKIKSNEFAFYNGRSAFNPSITSWVVTESTVDGYRYCLQQAGSHSRSGWYVIGFFN